MCSKNLKIQILDDVAAMSKAAAEKIVAHISESLQTGHRYSIALSGGSTPERLYALLADDAELREQIPWERVHFFWGDERHVPPSHPESNYLMAYNALLSKAPIPSTNIYRIRAEEPIAAKAARYYEQEIQKFFKIKAGELPRFNCVLLGMGPDGHIASLFPGTPGLQETNRLVTANWVEKFESYRITLTAPLLNNADRILLLVGGKEKADILKAVLENDANTIRFPVQLIQPTHGEMTWFLDQSAASRLALFKKK
ncbi:MAG: 6-phosphogluconolactonase [Desulfobacteraceae bacterium]|jgi:6-phosphogluconolactonase